MSMYNYGIGGNEVKKDAGEAIADIPSNKTLLIQKLTGYVSYVSGENPFNFPFKIWPSYYNNEKSLKIGLFASICRFFSLIRSSQVPATPPDKIT